MKVEVPGNGEAPHKYKGSLLFTQTHRALGFVENIDIPQQLNQINIIQTIHLILAMCNNSPSTEHCLSFEECNARDAGRKPNHSDTGLFTQAGTRLFLFSQLKDVLLDGFYCIQQQSHPAGPAPQSFPRDWGGRSNPPGPNTQQLPYWTGSQTGRQTYSLNLPVCEIGVSMPLLCPSLKGLFKKLVIVILCGWV